MRTILTLSLPLLIFAFCTGCPSDDPTPIRSGTPGANTPSDDKESEPPLVETMYPRVDPPEGETPAEGTVEVNVTPASEEVPAEPETTGIIAEPFGKYAAETVPMPAVEDLVAQLDDYIKKIGTNLDDLAGNANYKTDAADIVRDANALSLIALALGLAEADSKYKKSASNIIGAAKILAAAENHDAGKKAYEELKSALTKTEGGTPLSWSNKVADLTPMMKALPNLSSRVKNVTNTEAKLNTVLTRSPQSVYGPLAAMAVVSQGSIPNVTETTKPDAAAEWKKLCEEFRDAALKVNVTARQFAKDKADGKAADYAPFKASIDAMSASCDSCHTVFYPSAVGKE